MASLLSEEFRHALQGHELLLRIVEFVRGHVYVRFGGLTNASLANAQNGELGLLCGKRCLQRQGRDVPKFAGREAYLLEIAADRNFLVWPTTDGFAGGTITSANRAQRVPDFLLVKPFRPILGTAPMAIGSGL